TQPHAVVNTNLQNKVYTTHEFLTGTTIAIAVILLVLLVSPKNGSKTFGFVRRCPVCDHRLISRGSYCSECGSKV
ncbi:hypothetical protein ACFL3G_10680, partial [Planctomycetota bacterium]